MRVFSSLIILSSLLGVGSLAQGAESDGLRVELATGMGVYPDLQVPIDEDTGLRADGTQQPEVSRSYQGMPLAANFAMHFAAEPFRLSLDLDLMVMQPVQEVTSAGYQRLAFGLETAFGFSRSVIPMELALRLEGRRSRFINFSTGHNVDALLPTAKAKFFLGPYWRLGASFGQSLPANISYRSNQGGDRVGFEDATAQVQVLTGKITRRLSHDADLELGLSQEQVSIFIPDVYAYRETGLQLTRSGERSESYLLQTQVLSLGFVKHF